jgi:hypothetical protein
MGQLNELRSRRPSRATPNISISDGEGLYLRVRTTAKAWVYRYKRGGKETKLSLGPYPALSLAAPARRPAPMPRSWPMSSTPWRCAVRRRSAGRNTYVRLLADKVCSSATGDRRQSPRCGLRRCSASAVDTWMVSSSNEAISCVLDTLEDRMGDCCVKAVRQPCIDRSDDCRRSLNDFVDHMLDLMALVC